MLFRSLAFTLVFGAANGLSTIVRGAVPLALFGTRGYGEILGILATPYLLLNAIAPLAFSLIVDRIGIDGGVIVMIAVGLLASVSMEVMARWYGRQSTASRSA